MNVADILRVQDQSLTANTPVADEAHMRTNFLVLGFVAVSFTAAVLFGLSAFFGTGFVYSKLQEFTVRNLSRIWGQGPLLVTVACCLIGEVILVGYEKSSLKRLRNPSKSARSDLYLFALRITGLILFIDAALTFGASEWLPMILRKLPLFDISKFTGSPSVKFFVIYLTLDFARYWVHRFSHTWRWSWEGHKLHHAATEMNMITASRAHPLDQVIGLLIIGIPAAVLGSSAFVAGTVITTLTIILSMLHHSNLGWSWGWFGKYVICSPRYHRIHHSIHKEHTNKNYCEYVAIWDWLFGTLYDGPIEPGEFGCVENQYNKRGLVYDFMEGTRHVYLELGRSIGLACRSLLRNLG